MRLVLIPCTLALAIGMTSTAHAVTLSSPMLSAVPGVSQTCTVTNVHTKPVEVAIRIFDFFGSEIAASDGCAEDFGGVLPAGGSCAAGVSPRTARCVVVASSAKVRAVWFLRDLSGNTVVALPLTSK